MRETDVILENKDLAVKDPHLTLVESLDLGNRLASAMRGVNRDRFAAALGISRVRWWKWRSKGQPPVKVDEYLHIIARFPELRGTVWRHLLHRALTEVDGEE